jgi:hypothetical protein
MRLKAHLLQLAGMYRCVYAGTFWAARALPLSCACYVAFLYCFWRLGKNLALGGSLFSLGQVCGCTTAVGSSSSSSGAGSSSNRCLEATLPCKASLFCAALCVCRPSVG